MTQEYKALVKYQGGETSYTFPFLYLRKKFVKVRYQKPDGTFENLEYAKDYKVEEKTVNLNVAGSSDDIIWIYRQTPTEQIIDYADSTILKAYDLNVNQIQLLHILEETQDNTWVASDNANEYDAREKRLINVSDPVGDEDVVNKKYLYDKALCLDTPTNTTWDGESRQIKNVADPVDKLDAVNNQTLDSYVHDKALTINTSLGTHWDGEKRKLQNLAEPYDDTDAVTLGYMTRSIEKIAEGKLENWFALTDDGKLTPSTTRDIIPYSNEDASLGIKGRRWNEVSAKTLTADEVSAKTLTADEVSAKTLTADEVSAKTLTAELLNVLDITQTVADRVGALLDLKNIFKIIQSSCNFVAHGAGDYRFDISSLIPDGYVIVPHVVLQVYTSGSKFLQCADSDVYYDSSFENKPFFSTWVAFLEGFDPTVSWCIVYAFLVCKKEFMETDMVQTYRTATDPYQERSTIMDVYNNNGQLRVYKIKKVDAEKNTISYTQVYNKNGTVVTKHDEDGNLIT